MASDMNYTHEYRSTDELPTPYIDERCIYAIASIWQIQPRVNVFQTLQPTSMKYELLRHLTLLRYPRQDRPDIRSIAVAGFYYASDSDAVVCFCCGLTVKGLRSNDTPIEVHCRLSDRCIFVQQNHEVNRRYFEQTPTETAIFQRFQFGTRETQVVYENQFEVENMLHSSEHTSLDSIAEEDRSLDDYVDIDRFHNLRGNNAFQNEIRHFLQNTQDTIGGTSAVGSDATYVGPSLITGMERRQETQAQNITMSNFEQMNNTYLGLQTERAQVTQPRDIIQGANGDNLEDIDTTETSDDDEYANKHLNPSYHEMNDSNTNTLTMYSHEQRQGLEMKPDENGEAAGRYQLLQNGSNVPILQANNFSLIDLNIYNATNRAPNEPPYISQDISRYLNLDQYERRLETFGSFPIESRVTPEELADAGFFYRGYADCVRCFHCGQDLMKWTNEDEPWIEHIDKSPTCRYVKEIWGSEFVRAATEGDHDALQIYKALFKARRLRILK